MDAVKMRGIVRREGEYWASIVLDYNVVGTGDTSDEAIKSSIWMAEAYIEEGRKLGRTLGELRRPAPLRLRIKFRVLKCLSRLSPGNRPGTDGRSMPFIQDLEAWAH
ncbi:MAG: hypothetical protein GX113_03775 [Actinobacteria bacterium]|jgi:hypothetical protein|nr:hypothetical protein [Actinomycetota bacterium]